MADGFSFSIITKPVTDALAARVKLMDRATMWALRETGRVCRAAAKADAPVLTRKEGEIFGYGGMSQKTFKLDRKGAGVNAPVYGLLRSSIKPSRVVKHAGGMYSMTVGPRGYRVRLYAGKIEAIIPYMEAGQRAAIEAAPWIWRDAVGKVMR